MEAHLEREIINACIPKIKELDQKIYEALEEHEDTIVEDITNGNLDYVFESAKDMYALQSILNCVGIRLAKKTTIHSPGGEQFPPGP